MRARLLKPFGPVRFAAAMERVRNALGEPSAHPSLDRFTEALSQAPMSRLFVRGSWWRRCWMGAGSR